jgi:transcription elongation GreA/GreB family factor
VPSDEIAGDTPAVTGNGNAQRTTLNSDKLRAGVQRQTPKSACSVGVHVSRFLLLNSPFLLCFMSRAFIKEDVDPPERSERKRSASGLPPGATNYMTARGAKRLREELQKLRAANAGSERIIELEQILASGHVVGPPDAPSNSVTFGATVTVKDEKGATESFTIVGVDELDFERGAVSWISPLGKALLAADMGDWVKLDDGRRAEIVKIEYR